MDIESWFDIILREAPEGIVLDLKEDRTLCVSEAATGTNLDFFLPEDNPSVIQLYVIRDLDFDPGPSPRLMRHEGLLYEPLTGLASVEERFELPLSRGPEWLAKTSFLKCLPRFQENFAWISKDLSATY